VAKMEAAATWEPIDSLTPWDRNPRRNDGAVESVAHSITRFGFGAPIIARASDRVIIGGHTRYKAAQKLGLDKVPVRFLDLDPAEAAALALADNKLGELAEWDDAGVAAILAELEAQGAPIDGLGWDDDELMALLGDGLEAATPADELSDLYTKKINAPIYEPHGPCPEVSDLYDTSKTDDLVAEVEAADLPAQVRSFLIAAAQRHTVINFRQVAEFYAHAPASTQRLMERSALVIIDFDKAIEEGFIRLTKQMGALADLEAEDDA